MNRFQRALIVAILVSYGLFSIFETAAPLWLPRASIGLTVGYGAWVRAVEAGGPAARAGIVKGDAIDLAATPFRDRRFVAGVGGSALPGRVVRFRIVHDGLARDVALVAAPVELDGPDRLAILVELAATAIFIVVGATIVLVRPSIATWGFGTYCLLDPPTERVPSQMVSTTAALAALALLDIVQNVGLVGLLVFAFEFPKRANSQWQYALRRALPAVGAVLCVMTLYPDVANILFARGAMVENAILQVVFGLVFLVGLLQLADTFHRVDRVERDRMRYVLVGFSVGLVTTYVGNVMLFSSIVAPSVPQWLETLLISLDVLLPLAVAYAVIRHRVLDINVVVSRTLVFASLTAALAGVFAVLDWLFGTVLDEFRLTRIAQAATSIGVAFAFDALQKRAEAIVESVFFRKRRAAERRLTAYAADLPKAQSVAVIENVVIGATVDALSLASAALFLARGSAFERGPSFGWKPGDLGALDDSDVLVLALRSRDRAVTLAELGWHRADVPTGSLAPLIAIPLEAAATMYGFLVYGGHTGGGEIDSDEIALLERLAHAAGDGFDQIETRALREAYRVQGDDLAKLASRVDELRRLVADAK